MKKIFTLCVIAFALIACNPQKTALTDLEKFTERLEQESGNYSPAEWDEAAQHYDEITTTLERYQYSDEELQNIGRLEARCTLCFLKYYATQVEEQTHDALQEGAGFLDGLLNGLGVSEE